MTEILANNPIDWIKWAVVFGVLIVAFVISAKIIKKLSYVLQGQKKVDEATAKGHVIKAYRVSSRSEYENFGKRHEEHKKNFASYEYEIDGETKTYNGYFKYKIPPKKITLYYIDNPKRVFCMDDYQWNPFGGMIYLIFILVPFLLAAFAAVQLGVVTYDAQGNTAKQDREELLGAGGVYEGSITHNEITVQFKTPGKGLDRGVYDWLTYYTDEEEKTDVRVEFGFVDALPQMSENQRLEECVLWDKEMVYEIRYVPFEDEYGSVREQEQLLAYWQLAENTYFMVVATGEWEELSNAYSQLINDEKFQSSFIINNTND